MKEPYRRDRYEPHERARATAEDLARYRKSLPYLEYSLTMIGEEDGIRYTFCAPGIARGVVLEPWIGISYHTTFRANGAKWAKGSQLESLERYMYEGERRKIVHEILSGIGGMHDPGPDYDAENFFRKMEKAIDKAQEMRRNLVPVPKPKARLEIRRLRGAWWLLHPAWMPLSFDSFEEAAQFAQRFVVRRNVSWRARNEGTSGASIAFAP